MLIEIKELNKKGGKTYSYLNINDFIDTNDFLGEETLKNKLRVKFDGKIFETDKENINNIIELKMYLTQERLMYNSWIKKQSVDDLIEEKINNTIYDSSNAINYKDRCLEKDKGYFGSENVAHGYFNGEYSKIAYIVQIEYKSETVYVLLDEYMDYDEITVFSNLEIAMKYLDEVETWDLSIDKQIENFMQEIEDNRISVDAEREILHPHGNFYSFKIFLNDNILEDTVYSLDSNDVKSVIAAFDELEKELAQYNISIESVEKEKDNIGFDRYFNFKFYSEEIEDSIEKSIKIPCYMQGITKKVSDYVDIDEILQEFEELRI